MSSCFPWSFWSNFFQQNRKGKNGRTKFAMITPHPHNRCTLKCSKKSWQGLPGYLASSEQFGYICFLLRWRSGTQNSKGSGGLCRFGNCVFVVSTVLAGSMQESSKRLQLGDTHYIRQYVPFQFNPPWKEVKKFPMCFSLTFKKKIKQKKRHFPEKKTLK